jgi:hypothetical protein
MTAFVFSIIFTLCLILTATGWYVTNFRTKNISSLNREPLIEDIDDERNGNTGYRFSQEEILERTDYIANKYMDIL